MVKTAKIFRSGSDHLQGRSHGNADALSRSVKHAKGNRTRRIKDTLEEIAMLLVKKKTRTRKWNKDWTRMI